MPTNTARARGAAGVVSRSPARPERHPTPNEETADA
jgi:hypothetical protein